MMKVVHDFQFNKAGIGCNLSLALSSSKRHVAVAGRTVFNLFSIEESNDNEKVDYSVKNTLANLGNYQTHHRKMASLDTAIADIVWSPLDDTKLAWGSTNNKVFVLDMVKEDFVMFHKHTRCVNSVVFHPTDAFLLSSSNDGTVCMYDLRSNKPQDTLIFSTCSETSVRCIDFSCINSNVFAAGLEPGTIQLWDIRNNTKPERSFHTQQSVITCAWHPNPSYNWLASGCHRQNTITLLDLNTPSFSGPKILDTIQLISPVLRIRWRPGKDYYIASTAKTCDKNIYVWDVRPEHHFLPDRIFDKHTGDMVTGFDWINSDWLISVGKDGKLMVHCYSEARNPSTSVNPNALCMNAYGMVYGMAWSSSYRKKPEAGSQSGSRLSITSASTRRINALNSSGIERNTSFNTMTKTNSYQREFNVIEFEPKVQQLRHLLNNSILADDNFVYLAKNYKLAGGFEVACLHNMLEAQAVNKSDLAAFWSLLVNLFPAAEEEHQDTTPAPPASNSGSHPTQAPPSQKDGSDTETTMPSSDNRGEENNQDLPQSDSNTGQEDEVEADDTEPSDGFAATLISGPSREPQDYLFSDGETNLPNGELEYDFTAPFTHYSQAGEDHKTPTPFVSSMGNTPKHRQRKKSGLGRRDTVLSDSHEEVGMDVPGLTVSSLTTTELVSSLMLEMVDAGHIQTVAVALVLLGERARELVEEAVAENWMLSYLDLLHSYQLFLESNRIIALSIYPGVCILNQQSTSISLLCAGCNQPSKSGFTCARTVCKLRPLVCVICHETVRGLFLWSRSCQHGGHMSHLLEWYSKEKVCPECGAEADFAV